MTLESTSSKHAAATSDPLFIELFDCKLTKLYTVPIECVTSPLTTVRLLLAGDFRKLILCRHHGDANDPCSHANCKFVHISCALSDVPPPVTVHCNYVYHNQDDCVFPRLPQGGFLHVLNSELCRLKCVRAVEMIPDLVPSDCVLATRGALNMHVHSGQLSCCDEFSLKNVCRLGAECPFIHVICVGPDMVPHGFCRAALSYCSQSGRRRRLHVMQIVLDPATGTKVLKETERKAATHKQSKGGNVAPHTHGTHEITDDAHPRRHHNFGSDANSTTTVKGRIRTASLPSSSSLGPSFSEGPANRSSRAMHW